MVVVLVTMMMVEIVRNIIMRNTRATDTIKAELRTSASLVRTNQSRCFSTRWRWWRQRQITTREHETNCFYFNLTVGDRDWTIADGDVGPWSQPRRGPTRAAKSPNPTTPFVVLLLPSSPPSFIIEAQLAAATPWKLSEVLQLLPTSSEKKSVANLFSSTSPIGILLTWYVYLTHDVPRLTEN